MMCHMSQFCYNYGTNSMCCAVIPICEHYKGQVSFECNIPDWLISKIECKIERLKTARCACRNEAIKALESVLKMTYDNS